MRRNSFLPLLERRDPHAEVTLFCLPHAGGSAMTYAQWPGVFPSWVDVQPVELPGRGGLLNRPLVTDADLLVATLARALLPVIDRPFALFGHSMGGMLVAELASWLMRYGHPMPELLVISGRGGGPTFPGAMAAEALPDEDLAGWMLGLGGTDPLVLMDPDVLDITIRSIRADLRLCLTYQRTFTRLPTPLLCLCGTDDQGVSAAEVAAWQEHTSSRFRSVQLPGDHFYYRRHLAEVARLTTEEIRRMPSLATGPDHVR